MVPSARFGMMPANAMHSVDLPAPVGPMMPTKDPDRMSKLTRLRLSTGLLPSVSGAYFHPKSRTVIMTLTPCFHAFFPQPATAFHNKTRGIAFHRQIHGPAFT